MSTMFVAKDAFSDVRRYIYYNIKHEQHDVVFWELLMSGDIELNPCPVENANS